MEKHWEENRGRKTDNNLIQSILKGNFFILEKRKRKRKMNAYGLNQRLEPFKKKEKYQIIKTKPEKNRSNSMPPVD